MFQPSIIYECYFSVFFFCFFFAISVRIFPLKFIPRSSVGRCTVDSINSERPTCCEYEHLCFTKQTQMNASEKCTNNSTNVELHEMSIIAEMQPQSCFVVELAYFDTNAKQDKNE